MGQKSTPGLARRGRIWWIRKTLYGVQVVESTGCEKLGDAEEVLRKRIEQIRQCKIHGQRRGRTFFEAAEKYVAWAKKVTLRADGYHLDRLMPFIGEMDISMINAHSLQKFIEAERRRGVKTSTINHELQVVRRILNVAASEWVDEFGLTWLQSPPIIKMLPKTDARPPRPITWEEQGRLFAELPRHLQLPCLFKVNTGCREAEVCGLRWEWEHKIPELATTVFIIPGSRVKNGIDRMVVLNESARNVINQCRGVHPEYVFTYAGRRLGKINARAWRRARRRVGLEDVRVHDLKHTWGYRLRLSGVPEEDRKELLGHKAQKSMTTHYSSADIKTLIDYANRVEQTRVSPSLIVLQKRSKA